MDDTIKLQFQLLGAEGVKDLEEKLAATKAEGVELAAALGRGEISSAEFDAEMKRVAVSAKNLEGVVRSLNAEMQRQADDRAADALEAQAEAARKLAVDEQAA